jgi:hypothetical protein
MSFELGAKKKISLMIVAKKKLGSFAKLYILLMRHLAGKCSISNGIHKKVQV